MEILKRNGQSEDYTLDKIKNVIRLAFLSVNQECTDKILEKIAASVEVKVMELVEKGVPLQVEMIQDQIEITLTEMNYYGALKSFILYRNERSRERAARQSIMTYFMEFQALDSVLKDVQKSYMDLPYSLEHLLAKFLAFQKPDMRLKEKLAMLTKAAVELTTQEAPKW